MLEQIGALYYVIRKKEKRKLIHRSTKLNGFPHFVHPRFHQRAEKKYNKRLLLS